MDLPLMKKTGDTLLIRTNNDHSNYIDTAFSTTSYERRTYSLIIEPTSVQGKDDCWTGNPAELLKLTLKSDEATGNIVRVLQADKVLPKSRACAYSYKVVRVIRREENLVVILTFSSPGFEGEDVQHIAVTTKITLL
jgi:predicted secreted protein